MKRLPDEVREKSRIETLKQMDLSQGLWIFGYGSLMWNPEFEFSIKHKAILKGYHRSFCVKATFARGTPENPGLSLGLKEGGETHGVVFKTGPDHLEEITRNLWNREMNSGILMPRWCPVRVDQNEFTALTFVADKHHPSYVAYDLETSAKIIRSASGKKGTCLEYLVNTVEQLDQMGVKDEHLKVLLEVTLRAK